MTRAEQNPNMPPTNSAGDNGSPPPTVPLEPPHITQGVMYDRELHQQMATQSRKANTFMDHQDRWEADQAQRRPPLYGCINPDQASSPTSTKPNNTKKG
ncbi:hypothetical protein HGB07_03205 [Candidatus Roizmanbacteria bacterium]|nr:hypothetical protein [Candidatus Roizmanbacteria bacterium]